MVQLVILEAARANPSRVISSRAYGPQGQQSIGSDNARMFYNNALWAELISEKICSTSTITTDYSTVQGVHSRNWGDVILSYHEHNYSA